MSATTQHTAPAAVIEAVFDRINAHDAGGLGAWYADDLSEDWPIIGHLDGKQAAIDYWTALFAAFPDLHVRTLRIMSDGEAVFVHWRMTGTFSGAPITGILPTGRAIDLRGTDYFTIRDGRISTAFVAYDGMSFAAQAGVLPPRGSLADQAMTAAGNASTRLRRLPNRWQSRLKTS
jgi:predicted ester cyclase